MNSEYGQRLSLQELKQRNTQQAVLPTLTTPHEASPTKADWGRMMNDLDTLWYHADRQTDLLESISRQMSQLPTRTQMDELLKAVKRLGNGTRSVFLCPASGYPDCGCHTWMVPHGRFC